MASHHISKVRDATHSVDGESLLIRGQGPEGDLTFEVPLIELSTMLQMVLAAAATARAHSRPQKIRATLVHEMRLRRDADGHILMGLVLQAGAPPINFRFPPEGFFEAMDQLRSGRDG